MISYEDIRNILDEVDDIAERGDEDEIKYNDDCFDAARSRGISFAM